MLPAQVLPGEYVQLGKQGSPRQGFVKPPANLPPNGELLAAKSFRQACAAIVAGSVQPAGMLRRTLCCSGALSCVHQTPCISVRALAG